MANPVVFRGNAGDFTAFLNRLPALLSGAQADTSGAVRQLKLRVGVAVLSQVQQDFVRKSRGGTGKDGIKWKPLAPSTIARRRTTRGELRKLGYRSRKRINLRILTVREIGVFERTYAEAFKRGLWDLPKREAHKRARRLAWRAATAGWITKREALAGRQVDILRDTGAMLRSLQPGLEDQPSNAPGQVFDVARPGSVIVGTTEKPWHQHGGPNLPARPMWPENGKIPAAWWPPIRRATNRGLSILIRRFLGQ